MADRPDVKFWDLVKISAENPILLTYVFLAFSDTTTKAEAADYVQATINKVKSEATPERAASFEDGMKHLVSFFNGLTDSEFTFIRAKIKQLVKKGGQSV